MQVRVSSLQELVYKQGQAGITKASVSVEFNNADKASSPVGYEHHDRITVTRQVDLCSCCPSECSLTAASRGFLLDPF